MSRVVLLRSVELFDGSRLVPGRRDLLVRNGRIAAVEAAGSVEPPAGARVTEGGAVLPGLVDAHVHVSFSTAEAIVRGGVTGALDLGEPIEAAFAPHPPLRVRAAGPLLTAPGGYPTRTWGANGYGLEVAGEHEAREAVAMLAGRGAAMIKVAITQEPSLDAAAVAVIVEAAAARGLRVAAHALRQADARVALAGGVDVLAHTPVEPLGDDTIAAFASRGTTVISTVLAFGGAEATRVNLMALAAAGCTIAYGTDLGNDGIEPGANAEELSIVAEACGGAEAALRAATAGAAALAGLAPARVRVGEPANIIVCDGLGFAHLNRPSMIWIDGEEIA
ncbi:MAG TPA: amidohydrolase family protein [Actinomycetota bacterium]|nr:amidohydrolase family protein [Actinomycetota bacterium]